jgi:hypothetical protein
MVVHILRTDDDCFVLRLLLLLLLLSSLPGWLAFLQESGL